MLQIYLCGEKIQEKYVNDLNNSFCEIYESIVKTKVKEDDILLYFCIAFSKYGYNTENPLYEIKAYFKSKEIIEIILFAQLLSRVLIQVIAIETDELWKTLCCKASIEGLCQDELISDII